MGTCVHFSRSLLSNSWWQTMAGSQALSRPPAAEGGGRRPAFTGLATQPYSATEVDGWQHKLSRVSQNRAAVHGRGGTLSVSAHAQGRPASVETTHESPYDIVLPGRGCLRSRPPPSTCFKSDTHTPLPRRC